MRNENGTFNRNLSYCYCQPLFMYRMGYSVLQETAKLGNHQKMWKIQNCDKQTILWDIFKMYVAIVRKIIK